MLRLAREAAHQLESAREHARLATLLSTMPVFLTLEHATGIAPLLVYWQALSEAGHAPIEYLEPRLEELRRSGSVLLDEALAPVAKLLHHRAEDDVSRRLLEELLRRSEVRGNVKAALRSHLELGTLEIQRAAYAAASIHFETAITLAAELDDTAGLASAYHGEGTVHMHQARYPEALDCFDREARIASDLGDVSMLASAMGNTGLVYWYLAKYDEAMQPYAERLAIQRRRGDRLRIAEALSGLAGLHYQLRQYELALAEYEEVLAIGQALGEKRLLLTTTINIGNVYATLGHDDEAFPRLEQSLLLAMELNHKNAELTILINLATMLTRTDRAQESLEYSERALVLARETSYKYGETYLLQGMARTLLRLNRYEEAASRAMECIALAQNLDKQDVLFLGELALATAESLLGDLEGAIARCERLEREATNDADRLQAQFYLWRLEPHSLRAGEPSRRDKILAHMEQLYEETKNSDYLANLEMLRIGVIPPLTTR